MLLATTVLGSAALWPAAAGAETAGPRPPQVAQSAAVRDFAIPPGWLSAALNRFADESGLQLLYVSSLTEGATSPGLVGRYTVENGLRQLLAGTGIVHRFTGPRTVALDRPAVGPTGDALQLDPVQVEGRGRRETAWGPVEGLAATRSASATKTDTPILETPQSISVVTRTEMERQGAKTLSEALEYTPGVGNRQPEARGDWTWVRGFFSQQYLDGMLVPYSGSGGDATMRIEPYGLERLEVLRGPSSVLYGQNTPGGLANAVSKRPTADPLGEVQVQAGSHERYQGAFDLGGPLDHRGTFLYRLTGLVRDSGTQTDYGKEDRVFIAPSFTWTPGPDTSFTIMTQYLQEDLATQRGLPVAGTLLPNVNGKVSRSRFLGEPDFDEHRRTQYVAGYAFEHRFDDVWSVRQNFRYAAVNSDFKQVGATGSLVADQRTVNRSASMFRRDSDTFTVDNQVQANFVTGPVDHQVAAGLDYVRYTIRSDSERGVAAPIDLFDPVYGSMPTGFGPSSGTRQVQNRTGVYLQDQIRWDKWTLTLSGRHDWSTTRTKNTTTGATTADQEDSAFSGRVGLVYLFDNGIAPYASYSQSFEPVAGTDFFEQPFDPTRGEQYEVGVKYQPPGTSSFVSAAVFQLTQQNVLTRDPDPTHVCGTGSGACSVQTGEIRVRGLELEGKVRLLPGLDVIASYTYSDGEVTKSNTGTQGNRASAMPRHQAALWADYAFPESLLPGLELGGGVRFTGQSWGDEANTVRIPSYTVVDAAVRYDLGNLSQDLEGARLALNVRNLFDKDYVQMCYGPATAANTCYLGAGRSVLATLSYRW